MVTTCPFVILTNTLSHNLLPKFYGQVFLLEVGMFSLYITCGKCRTCFSSYGSFRLRDFGLLKTLVPFSSGPVFYEVNELITFLSLTARVVISLLGASEPLRSD